MVSKTVLYYLYFCAFNNSMQNALLEATELIKDELNL